MVLGCYSDTQWSALANRLAKITSPSDQRTARILDQVARMSAENYPTAFRQQIRTFQSEEARIDLKV